MLEALFLRLLGMSAVSSYVIAAVLLLRLLLRCAPRIFSYLLWSAVLLRLLCPFAAESPVSLVPAELGNVAHMESATLIPEPSFEAVPAAGDARSAEHALNLTGLMSVVWALGAAAVAASGAVQLVRLRRRTVGAVRDESGAYLADGVDTAFVIGLVSPQIYLPSSASAQARELMLLHERTHIRRGDHILRLLAFAALALHWFNPLVWLAFAMSGRDMEMSCDEAAVRELSGDGRADYCQTLLNLAPGRRPPAAGLLSFGESDTSARVKNILGRKKRAAWLAGAAALIVAAALAALATDPLAPRGVSLEFPAYEADGAESCEPFTVSLELPDGWSAALPPEGERRAEAQSLAYGCTLYTPVYLLDASGEYAGFIGWQTYVPGSAVAEEAAYYDLTRGVHYFWQDFVSVTDSASTASIYCQQPVEDMPASAWPQIETQGVCAKSEALGVYVGLHLEPGALESAGLENLARSIGFER